MLSPELIERYDRPVPRYTSYPTVPQWSGELDLAQWELSVRTEAINGPLSIYIHLPYCESLCTYCGCNTRITVNHAVERPYIDALLKEWSIYNALIGSPVIREIHLGGGTPTFFSPQNLKLLIDGIVAGSSVTEDASFSFEAHPANTTKGHLQTLYDLGFRRLSLGIQDFDPEVQQYINRKQSIEDVRSVTEMARSIGYQSINYDLVYGLPKQRLDSLEGTIKLVKELGPDRIAFYSYAHVPSIRPAQRSFAPETIPTGVEKHQLYNLGRDLLLNAGYFEVGMDHFALPGDDLFTAQSEGNLHRNFMGYTATPSHLLIGLGASSISDSKTALAQNEKTVEQYMERLEHNQLPVRHGHLLNDADLRIRKVILDIMCRGKASLTELPDEAYPDRIELEPLIDDALISVENETLLVTEKGRTFLRNIAALVDPRLRIARQQTYSKAI